MKSKVKNEVKYQVKTMKKREINIDFEYISSHMSSTGYTLSDTENRKPLCLEYFDAFVFSNERFSGMEGCK